MIVKDDHPSNGNNKILSAIQSGFKRELGDKSQGEKPFLLAKDNKYNKDTHV